MIDYTTIVTLLVTMAGGVILHSWCGYLFSRKYSKLITFAGYLLGYITVSAVTLTVSSTLINGIVLGIVNSAIITVLYGQKLRTGLMHGVLLAGLDHLAGLISSMLLGIYTRDFSEYHNRVAIYTSLTVVSLLIFFILSTLAARLFSFKRLSDYGGLMAIKLLLLPVASVFIAIIVTYVSMYVSLPPWLQLMVYICLGGLFAANLYTVRIYDNAVLTQRENTAMKLALQKEQSDAELYRVISEQNDSQRILIHDIKNHLQIINGYAHEGKTSQIEDYITELGQSGGLGPQTRYSDNGILNMVITRLAHDCKKHGVEMYCDIREKCVDFMEDVDIASLFGNLCTNALEAAAESKDRSIDIDIQTKPAQRLTVISVSNSCDKKPLKDADGVLISQKGDGHHGIGQRSIARIVKKYNGTAENFYDENEKRFDWVIVFTNKKAPQ